MCDKCEHKPVCSIYRATGGVKSCEHHKEERRGRWEYHGGDDDMNLYGFCPFCSANWDEDIVEEFNFCPNCGADMRGTEDG